MAGAGSGLLSPRGVHDRWEASDARVGDRGAAGAFSLPAAAVEGREVEARALRRTNCAGREPAGTAGPAGSGSGQQGGARPRPSLSPSSRPSLQPLQGSLVPGSGVISAEGPGENLSGSATASAGLGCPAEGLRLRAQWKPSPQGCARGIASAAPRPSSPYLPMADPLCSLPPSTPPVVPNPFTETSSGSSVGEPSEARPGVNPGPEGKATLRMAATRQRMPEGPGSSGGGGAGAGGGGGEEGRPRRRALSGPPAAASRVRFLRPGLLAVSLCLGLALELLRPSGVSQPAQTRQGLLHAGGAARLLQSLLGGAQGTTWPSDSPHRWPEAGPPGQDSLLPLEFQRLEGGGDEEESHVAAGSHAIGPSREEPTPCDAYHRVDASSLRHTASGTRPLLLVVTPTYVRPFQAMYLRRLANTLRLVPPPLLWIVSEARRPSPETAALLRLVAPGLLLRHIGSGQPMRHIKDRGVGQRNAALELIEAHRFDGIVYFADDDNVYAPALFEEIRKVKRFGTWPVAMVQQGKSKPIVEGPVCDGRGAVVGWHTNEKSKRLRRFHVDMSGFAFNSTILWDSATWQRPHNNSIRQLDSIKEGFQETTFIEQLVADEGAMEGLAGSCSRVLVWHLHSEAPGSSPFPHWTQRPPLFPVIPARGRGRPGTPAWRRGDR